MKLQSSRFGSISSVLISFSDYLSCVCKIKEMISETSANTEAEARCGRRGVRALRMWWLLSFRRVSMCFIVCCSCPGSLCASYRAKFNTLWKTVGFATFTCRTPELGRADSPSGGSVETLLIQVPMCWHVFCRDNRSLLCASHWPW